ncbi:nucleoporin [Starmerella bacillaris]|uniref:Nucleoporin n=1 Tax=Starmerella bacillaris TaxID=1247836 RepID=A0AAV5RIC1_STABA|nr:nucleoporin [Starmerella bacillaris]
MPETASKPETSNDRTYTDSNSVLLWELVNTTEFKWFVSHVLVDVFGLLSLVYWQKSSVCDVFYRIAFFFSILSLLILQYKKYSKTPPTLNSLFDDENTHQLIFSVICLFSTRHVLALLPFLINSFFVCLTYIRSYILPAIGHANESPLSTRLREFVANFNEPLTLLSATFELLFAVQLWFLSLNFSMNKWAFFLLYMIYFRSRYNNSVYLRRVVKTAEINIDQVLGHPSMPPVVKQGWLKVKNFLNTSYNPESEEKKNE